MYVLARASLGSLSVSSRRTVKLPSTQSTRGDDDLHREIGDVARSCMDVDVRTGSTTV